MFRFLLAFTLTLTLMLSLLLSGSHSLWRHFNYSLSAFSLSLALTHNSLRRRQGYERRSHKRLAFLLPVTFALLENMFFTSVI